MLENTILAALYDPLGCNVNDIVERQLRRTEPHTLICLICLSILINTVGLYGILIILHFTRMYLIYGK